MNAKLNRMLAAARKVGASDVHLKVGQSPILRIKGQLRSVKDAPPLTEDALATFAQSMMNPKQKNVFEERREVDLAYSTPEGIRYRVNVFQQRSHTGMVLRIIPPEVPSFASLNLPEVLLSFAERNRGLILVTGVTGSGKSTTLAALVEQINHSRACHILTIEDPIEYIFVDRRSVVNQREIGLDTTTFARALRAGLRQDPDVILLGEMRDLETVEIALTAAETGHLVLSTLHTTDAVETINRIISVFPPHQQNQVRVQLASILVGVVSQRLAVRADGQGLVPAVEVLVATARVRELITDPEKTRLIRDAIAQGREPYGMISFDQSLVELVQNEKITYEEALACSSNADDFALYFRGIKEGRSEDGSWREAGQFRSGQAPAEGLQIERDLDLF
jgi:twitching motility protein PilT